VTAPDTDAPDPPQAPNGKPRREDRTNDQPVSTLRGAGARVDPRRVARVAIGLVLGTLFVLTIAFALVGAHKNQQIDELRNQGVPVTYTVTSCEGLLGGSGSNGAGFSCTGTYSIGGRRYREPLPDNLQHAPGAAVRAIAVPSDPTLLSTPQIVRSEHTSRHVYVLPGVFFVLFVLVLGAVALSRRRSARGGQAGGV
jgi:hypothetical protein